MIVEAIVPINIPIFRIFLAIWVIFFGVRLLSGKAGWHSVSAKRRGASTAFSEERHVFNSIYESGQRYSTVFGSTLLDFSKLALQDNHFDIQVRVVFGEQIIRIKKNTPYRIHVRAAFAGIETPEGDAPVLGSTVYTSGGYVPDKVGLDLDIAVAFGALKIQLVDEET